MCGIVVIFPLLSLICENEADPVYPLDYEPRSHLGSPVPMAIKLGDPTAGLFSGYCRASNSERYDRLGPVPSEAKSLDLFDD